MPTITLKPGTLNNRVDPIQLGEVDFRTNLIGNIVIAENVDFNSANQVTLRGGRTTRYSGPTHSLHTPANKPTETYFVEGGVLKQFASDYSVTTVATLQSDLPLFYEPVNQEVVVSNGVDIGWLSSGSYEAFAPSLDGVFEADMPAGQFLAFYKGVLYVAAGSIIYASKPHNIERRDVRISKIPMDGSIRMLAAVEDGLWVATDNRVVFLPGGGQEDFVYLEGTNKTPPNGAFSMSWELAKDSDGNSIRRRVVSWVSKEGICQGRAGGAYKSLSYPDIALPPGESGICFRRVINGIEQTVAVIRKPGQDDSFTAPTLSINSITVT